MPNALNDLVEAGVGIACITIAWATRRRPGQRWLGFLAATAGLAALGHAGWSLMTG